MIDLKSFVEQILKLQGKWSSPGGDVKLFCDEESKFSIKWYGQRSRKLIIQADSDEHYLKLEFQKLAGTCEDNNPDADDLRYVGMFVTALVAVLAELESLKLEMTILESRLLSVTSKSDNQSTLKFVSLFQVNVYLIVDLGCLF